ncbi:hypothetical protein GOP47_0029155 [Adiantum capillus-veneris]|nr:hypothetical protein GOP47_0029155 [Adiantum capillus-veneris]
MVYAALGGPLQPLLRLPFSSICSNPLSCGSAHLAAAPLLTAPYPCSSVLLLEDESMLVALVATKNKSSQTEGQGEARGSAHLRSFAHLDSHSQIPVDRKYRVISQPTVEDSAGIVSWLETGRSARCALSRTWFAGRLSFDTLSRASPPPAGRLLFFCHSPKTAEVYLVVAKLHQISSFKLTKTFLISQPSSLSLL